jgi:hypothetical protein
MRLSDVANVDRVISKDSVGSVHNVTTSICALNAISTTDTTLGILSTELTNLTPTCTNRFDLLPLDKVVVSRAVFVICPGTDGWPGERTGRRTKTKLRYLNNTKTV